ncbi:MAG: RluA family pseudouridine synthase [Pseudomonadota bacterium]
MKKGVQGPLAQSGNTPPPILVYRPPPDGELPVIHVDKDILVLSKPSGLLSVPGNRPELQDCMETRAQARFPHATTVHRLDRATSGLFLMALNPRAHAHIGKQFETRKTSKVYAAVVSGVVERNEGEINLALRTDWYNRPKQMVDICLGREAVTRWSVSDRLADRTRVELIPVTGRTHQLRVHMMELGHPILGDEFYAPASVISLAERLMLHAEKLEIFHPSTGERIKFHDPVSF